MSHRSIDATLRGVTFAKMTGSGNDFVFFDGREVDGAGLTSPEVIRAICSRHNGIGADGIVILEPVGDPDKTSTGPSVQARIRYFNSDGTPADLCGNATLCSTVMAIELGLAQPDGMGLDTPAGRIASRFVDGLPEITLQPVEAPAADVAIEMVSGEARMGLVTAGIPHLVVLCENAEQIDLAARGPLLRHHPAAGPHGANVNWVSPLGSGLWRYRTFERGVEGETLACGTGAVATAILLLTWEIATSPVRIRTSSGRDLEVTLERREAFWHPTLRGEGRVVFRGAISDLHIESITH